MALAGPMGSGKTTVGRLYAARVGVPFVDVDERIGDIPGIWAEEGEVGFRLRERRAVRELASGTGVLALGGGVLSDPENREALSGWTVVVLMAGLDELRARIGSGQGRPLHADLERLMRERAAVWAQAGATLRTDGRTPEQVVDALEVLCASR